ncbi:MAG: HAD family hydrolase [Acidothermus cellulolyticus]|nr:HAD family hydrolase [Acidothermus cellulolyticus]
MTVTSIRLVATDLDGTLVRSDGTVSPRTVTVLRRVVDAGAVVVLVSGRPPRWMKPVIAATGIDSPAICANGAIIYDPRADRVVEEFLLAPVDVARIVAVLAAAAPDVRFAVETGADTYAVDGYRGGWHQDGGARPCSLRELVGLAAAKLLVYHPRLSADELLEFVRPRVDAIAEVTHSNGRNLVEISAKGVSKASTVALLAARMGISAAEVVAFGDMPNDIGLLRWAGCGYAMTNAHPAVRAAADALAPSNDADGVARVLEDFLGSHKYMPEPERASCEGC